MEQKIYAMAVRDLFRAYCEVCGYSAKAVTEDVIKKVYGSFDSGDAIDALNKYEESFKKLRYSPKSSTQRDITLEKQEKLRSYVVHYLHEHQPGAMEKISLLCSTISMVKEFNVPSNSNQNEKELSEKFYNNIRGFSTFVGNKQIKNVPSNLGYVISSKKVKEGYKGIVINLDLWSSNWKLGSQNIRKLVDPYNIYTLKFHHSRDLFQTHGDLRSLGPEANCELELAGVEISLKDNLFMFKCRSSEVAYMARYSINSDGFIEWEFLSTVPKFDALFKKKKPNAKFFPVMFPVEKDVLSTSFSTIDPVYTYSKLVFNLLMCKEAFKKLFIYITKFDRLVKLYRKSKVKFWGGGDVFNLVRLNRYDDLADIVRENLSIVNQVDKDGNTIIHVAILLGRNDIAAMLIDVSVADFTIRNNNGHNVYDVANYSNLIFNYIRRKLIVNSKDNT